jgi:phage-related baseplate assembly protein
MDELQGVMVAFYCDSDWDWLSLQMQVSHAIIIEVQGP